MIYHVRIGVYNNTVAVTTVAVSTLHMAAAAAAYDSTVRYNLLLGMYYYNAGDIRDLLLYSIHDLS